MQSVDSADDFLDLEPIEKRSDATEISAECDRENRLNRSFIRSLCQYTNH